MKLVVGWGCVALIILLLVYGIYLSTVGSFGGSILCMMLAMALLLVGLYLLRTRATRM